MSRLEPLERYRTNPVTAKVANLKGERRPKHNLDTLARYLNELGEDGWEVVGRIGFADIVLKRPKL